MMLLTAGRSGMAKWLNAGVLCLLVGFLVGGAQTAAAQSANGSTTNSLESTPPRIGGANAREGNGAARNNGQSDWAIAELVRIDRRITAIDDQIARANLNRSATNEVEQASRVLAELKRSPDRACAAGADARLRFRAALVGAMGALSNVSGRLDSIYPWEQMRTEEVSALCDEPAVAAIARMEAGVTQMNSELQAAAGSVDDLRRERDEQQTRKHQIVEEMSNQVASARVSRTMPYILIIIFALGVIMLGAGRLFSPEIQSELICSGQLVQYATILILFGALIALGLADKLQEQTLAALLGGLAGYVLSQGVGQKDQRATLQTIRTMAATAPGRTGENAGGTNGG
jgi:hypothetical protein